MKDPDFRVVKNTWPPTKGHDKLYERITYVLRRVSYDREGKPEDLFMHDTPGGEPIGESAAEVNENLPNVLGAFLKPVLVRSLLSIDPDDPRKWLGEEPPLIRGYAADALGRDIRRHEHAIRLYDAFRQLETVTHRSAKLASELGIPEA
jgi:hypothetical protein